MSRRGAILVPLLLCTAARSMAAPPPGLDTSTLEEARRTFALGSELYAKGRYREALQEFQVGAALKPDPAFDYDIAQCYLKLGNLPEARTYLLRTLHDASPDSAYIPRAQQDLGKIDAAMTSSSAPASAPTPAASRAPASSLGASSPAAVQPPRRAPLLLPSPETPSRVPFYVTATGAAALCVAGATFALLGSAKDSALHDYEPSQTAAGNDLSSARTDYLLADIFVPAGVVAAGLATWLYFGERPTIGETQVSLVVTPGGASVGVAGSWEDP